MPCVQQRQRSARSSANRFSGCAAHAASATAWACATSPFPNSASARLLRALGCSTPCSTATAAPALPSARCMRDKSIASACSRLSGPSAFSKSAGGTISLASRPLRRCPARTITASRPASHALSAKASSARRLFGEASCHSQASAAARIGSPASDSISQARPSKGLKPGKALLNAVRRCWALSRSPASARRRIAASCSTCGAAAAVLRRCVLDMSEIRVGGRPAGQVKGADCRCTERAGGSAQAWCWLGAPIPARTTILQRGRAL